MKKTLYIILILIVLAGILTGCAGKTKSEPKTAIDVYVDGYPFSFSLSGVSNAKNGHTIINMAMVPQKNEQGKEPGLETAMKAANMLMMQTYIVCDGVEYDYNKSTNMTLSVKDKKMHYLYNFEFDTDKKPEKIFFYPVNKRSESDFHWEIDPTSGVILKEAAVTKK